MLFRNLDTTVYLVLIFLSESFDILDNQVANLMILTKLAIISGACNQSLQGLSGIYLLYLHKVYWLRPYAIIIPHINHISALLCSMYHVIPEPITACVSTSEVIYNGLKFKGKRRDGPPMKIRFAMNTVETFSTFIAEVVNQRMWFGNLLKINKKLIKKYGV